MFYISFGYSMRYRNVRCKLKIELLHERLYRLFSKFVRWRLPNCFYFDLFFQVLIPTSWWYLCISFYSHFSLINVVSLRVTKILTYCFQFLIKDLCIEKIKWIVIFCASITEDDCKLFGHTLWIERSVEFYLMTISLSMRALVSVYAQRCLMPNMRRTAEYKTLHCT